MTNLITRLRSLLPLTLVGGAFVVDPAFLADAEGWQRAALMVAAAVASALWQWFDTNDDGNVTLDEVRDRLNSANSPAWVALVALTLTLAACGGAPVIGVDVFVNGEASAAVELRDTGLPALVVEAEGSGGASVDFDPATMDASVEADAGVCARARFGPWSLLSETCAGTGE